MRRVGGGAAFTLGDLSAVLDAKSLHVEMSLKEAIGRDIYLI
ncbi:hypothetical protein SH668x_002335 [Planctomicrobium sp. SH668]